MCGKIIFIGIRMRTVYGVEHAFMYTYTGGCAVCQCVSPLDCFSFYFLRIHSSTLYMHAKSWLSSTVRSIVLSTLLDPPVRFSYIHSRSGFEHQTRFAQCTHSYDSDAVPSLFLLFLPLSFLLWCERVWVFILLAFFSCSLPPIFGDFVLCLCFHGLTWTRMYTTLI